MFLKFSCTLQMAEKSQHGRLIILLTSVSCPFRRGITALLLVWSERWRSPIFCTGNASYGQAWPPTNYLGPFHSHAILRRFYLTKNAIKYLPLTLMGLFTPLRCRRGAFSNPQKKRSSPLKLTEYASKIHRSCVSSGACWESGT